MKIIDLKYQEVSKDLVGTRAHESDMGLTISEPTIIRVDGKPSVVYGNMKFYEKIVRWAKSYKFSSVERIQYRQGKAWDDIKTREEYFGYTAPRPVFNVAAGPTKTSRNYPDVYINGVVPLASELESLFSRHLSEQFNVQNSEALSTIGPCWRMGGGMYTQCVVNDNNAFNYHFDGSNYPGHWNSMAVFKWGVVGGHTVLPNYDCKLIMDKNHFVIFDAHRTMHAVTPIIKRKKEGFRYSVVFYTQSLMKNLGTMQEETAKFHKVLEKRLDPDYQDERKKIIISRRRDRSGSSVGKSRKLNDDKR